MQPHAIGNFPPLVALRTTDVISKIRTQKTVALVQTQAENAGAQEVARQLASGFEKQGWNTRQIFFYRRTDAFDAEPNTFYCASKRPNSPLEVLKMLAKLYRAFRAEKPDVVVTLQHYGNVIAAPVARLAGAPIIIANQLTGCDLIPKPVRFADKALGMAGFYDHVVVNSAEIEAAYAIYPASYTRRVTRIDHGFLDKSVPVSKHEARAQLGLPQQVELLGYAARLHPVKRIDLAIRLLREDAGQHLALAGQGEERLRLEQFAQSLGVAERVHFLGELDTARMGVFLAALDCFVFSSASESFGLAPAEAAQAGVPVVANDLAVLRDVLAVNDEPCAIFVDASDTKAFAAAVSRALHDTTLANILKARGRRLVERYPLDAMVDDFLHLMEPPTKARDEE